MNSETQLELPDINSFERATEQTHALVREQQDRFEMRYGTFATQLQKCSNLNETFGDIIYKVCGQKVNTHLASAPLEMPEDIKTSWRGGPRVLRNALVSKQFGYKCDQLMWYTGRRRETEKQTPTIAYMQSKTVWNYLTMQHANLIGDIKRKKFVRSCVKYRNAIWRMGVHAKKVDINMSGRLAHLWAYNIGSNSIVTSGQCESGQYIADISNVHIPCVYVVYSFNTRHHVPTTGSIDDQILRILDLQHEDAAFTVKGVKPTGRKSMKHTMSVPAELNVLYNPSFTVIIPLNDKYTAWVNISLNQGMQLSQYKTALGTNDPTVHSGLLNDNTKNITRDILGTVQAEGLLTAVEGAKQNRNHLLLNMYDVIEHPQIQECILEFGKRVDVIQRSWEHIKRESAELFFKKGMF